MPEHRSRSIEIQQLLLKQRLLTILPFDNIDEGLSRSSGGYVRKLLSVIRHPFRVRHLGSEGGNKTGRQHLIKVIAVLVQVLIVGLFGVFALVHPIDCAKKITLPGAERDELVSLKELEIQQAPLHKHDAVL